MLIYRKVLFSLYREIQSRQNSVLAIYIRNTYKFWGETKKEKGMSIYIYKRI